MQCTSFGCYVRRLACCGPRYRKGKEPLLGNFLYLTTCVCPSRWVSAGTGGVPLCLLVPSSHQAQTPLANNHGHPRCNRCGYTYAHTRRLHRISRMYYRSVQDRIPDQLDILDCFFWHRFPMCPIRWGPMQWSVSHELNKWKKGLLGAWAQ